MKKSFKIISALILSFTMAFGLGATIFATTNKPVNETEAASDYTSASHIASYYSTVSGTGSSLLSSICTKISNPFTAISYSNLKNHYETTDSRGDGYLYDIYSSSTNYKISDGGSSASSVGGGWNKEHTIVKQWWGGDQTSQGSDIIIVRLSDIHCNSVRGNYLFGEVGTSTDNTIGDNKFGNCSNYSEIGVTNSTTVFEPRDEIKGEMARTYFYAAARYLNNGAGNGAAKNWTTANGSYIFSSSGNNGFVQKYLNMLLRWHREYPVSQREITRNGNVESCQSNRNPFIDHPSWVDLIWGGTYPSSGLNYENTSNGTATVTNGAISGGSSTNNPTASISGTTSVTVGNSTTLTASLSNVTSANNITWTSSNTSVATVTKGSTTTSSSTATVTGVAAGSATIYCKHSGTTIGQVTVTVSAAATPTISISATKTSIAVNDSSTLTATTTNAGTPTITWSVKTGSSYVTLSSTSGSSITVTGKAVGTAIIKASITMNSTSYEATKDITVTSSGGSSSGNASLYTGTLTEGDYVLVYSGKAMKNTVSSNRLGYSDVTITDNTISSPASSIIWHIAPSGNYWTIYNSSETSYAASNGTKNQAALSTTITDNALWSCSSSDGTYDFTNKANSENSVNAILRNNGTYGFACYGSSTGGALSLYKINGSSSNTPTLSSISINQAPTKTTYTAGEYFDPTGLKLNLIYSDTSYNTTVTYSSSNSDDFIFNPTTSTALTTSNTGVSITYGGKTTSQAITVNPSGGSGSTTTYSLVTNGLTAGDQVIISAMSAQSDSTAYTLTNTYNSSTPWYLKSQSATVTNTTIEYDSSTMNLWTVGGNSSSGYTFTCDGGSNYLRAYKNSNNKYGAVCLDSDYSTSPNNWSMTYTTNKGYTLKVTDSSNDVYLEFSGTSYNTFKGQGTMPSDWYINFFRKTTTSTDGATTFAATFMSAFTCDATGTNAPTFTTTWAQLKTAFNALTTTDQDALKNATANESGTDIEKAVARYDYVVSKYSYEDFMDRDPGNGSNRMNAFKGTSTNNILLILGSISLLGGLTYLAYFLKKRKED